MKVYAESENGKIIKLTVQAEYVTPNYFPGTSFWKPEDIAKLAELFGELVCLEKPAEGQ